MPLVKITTNQKPEPARQSDLLRKLSATVAAGFGKPERWVMTCLDSPAAMTFGASDAPAAYVEVKNIGKMTGAQTKHLSAEITREVASQLAVPPNRIYIEFADASEHLWGYDGDTFE